MAIGDIKNRLRAKFNRRNSTASSNKSTTDIDETPNHGTIRSTKSRGSKGPASTLGGRTIDEKFEGTDSGVVEGLAANSTLDEVEAGERLRSEEGSGDLQPRRLPQNTFSSAPNSSTTGAAKTIAIPPLPLSDHKGEKTSSKHDSTSTDFPTPNTDIAPVPEEEFKEARQREAVVDANTFGQQGTEHIDFSPGTPADTTEGAKSVKRPGGELQRRQSLLPHGQTRLIKTLLETELPSQARAANLDYFTANGPSTISANMVSRKLWVKRPGGSATLVTINEDDLVDDVRDMILKKYANSLGRSFDSPDVTLRIVPREQRQERTLGPEEPMGRTMDAYFPGGQTVDEALIIDVPLRRTPRPSPHARYYEEGLRPSEQANEYFPPMPAPAPPSPHLPNTLPVNLPNHSHSSLAQHSISVLTTGHVPPLPSPGSRRPHHSQGRPRMGRQHTSSPTIISNHQPLQVTSNGTQHSQYSRVFHARTHSSASEKSNAPASAPPLPTPPPLPLNAEISQIQRVTTPPPRVSSPRPPAARQKRKKVNADHPSLPSGMLNGAVPPINVLIVEDNIINLKLLEAFMKRLKVRWQTAMNGKEAVTKWRAGGFHLVLMDIQLPIMSGLEATKEIRRLERLNSIGVFSSSASSVPPSVEEDGEVDGDDKLPSSILFKSPVIIVALTASSLQSDRHEALAAGCNDFLTKPVNFVWLERKVMEWGCMQALIDFDGWRKWKDFSQVQQVSTDELGGDKKKGLAKKKKGNRVSVGSNSGLGGGLGKKSEVSLVGGP